MKKKLIVGIHLNQNNKKQKYHLVQCIKKTTNFIKLNNNNFQIKKLIKYYNIFLNLLDKWKQWMNLKEENHILKAFHYYMIIHNVKILIFKNKII